MQNLTGVSRKKLLKAYSSVQLDDQKAKDKIGVSVLKHTECTTFRLVCLARVYWTL